MGVMQLKYRAASVSKTFVFELSQNSVSQFACRARHACAYRRQMAARYSLIGDGQLSTLPARFHSYRIAADPELPLNQSVNMFIISEGEKIMSMNKHSDSQVLPSASRRQLAGLLCGSGLLALAGCGGGGSSEVPPVAPQITLQ